MLVGEPRWMGWLRIRKIRQNVEGLSSSVKFGLASVITSYSIHYTKLYDLVDHLVELLEGEGRAGGPGCEVSEVFWNRANSVAPLIFSE